MPGFFPVQVPNVFRNEYTLIDINEEGYVSVLYFKLSYISALKLPHINAVLLDV
jgi:hypothetical protein